MNLRATLLLVTGAAIAGLIVYTDPFGEEEEPQRQTPWFYRVSADDIEAIEIDHQGARIRINRVALDVWEFEHPSGIPPAQPRWRGVTLLLSGPRTSRELTAGDTAIEDLAQYGLDNPSTIVKLGLRGGRRLQFRLGDKTTDGANHYAQVVGFTQLFLIDAAWGDVMAGLATEPPLPKWYVKRDPSGG